MLYYGKPILNTMMFEDKINTIIEKIVGRYDPKAIIVFGSVAKGTSTEDSDLDVAVILESNLSEHERNTEIRVCIGPIGVAMDLLVFTPEEVESQRNDHNPIISEILETGKVVYGTI